MKADLDVLFQSKSQDFYSFKSQVLHLLSAMEEYVDNAHREIEDLKNTLEQLESELDDATDEIIDLNEQIDELEDELDEY